MLERPSTAGWWLPREVPVGETLRCRIGPLVLSVGHVPGEWQVAFSHEEEEEHAGTAPSAPGDADGDDDVVGERERFIVAGEDPQLRLLPLLMDRAVVIRPREAVFLPEGEEITLYMSTPVAVAIPVGAAQRLLREVFSVPLSETWFGPSTREGELCYAGRTTARQHRRDLPRRAHRAITPVRIRNEAASPLPLTKLSLPVPVLSLYGAEDGSLWTEGVSLVRQNASDVVHEAASKIDADALNGRRTTNAHLVGSSPIYDEILALRDGKGSSVQHVMLFAVGDVLDGQAGTPFHVLYRRER